MAKSGQQQNNYFIDKWCAKHIRKVVDCHLCLHYDACSINHGTVSPAAIEHNLNKGKSNIGYFNDVNVVEEEDD